jgi:competence protein ComEA
VARTVARVQGAPHSTVVVWLIALVLAALAGMRLLGDGEAAAPAVSVDGSGGRSAAGGVTSPRAGSEEEAGAEADVYVHVAGAVRRPGLIRLPSGARVATALERAGGPRRRADLTLVNLAARVQDGQQIVVPVAGRAGGAAAGAAASAAAGAAPPGAKIPLSSATPEQLDEVDGIGPTLAERIVQYRDAHGGFRSLDELANVDGIGTKRLATLREALDP